MALLVAGTTGGLWLVGRDHHMELEGRRIGALGQSAEEKELLAVVDDHSVLRRGGDGEWRLVGEVDSLRLTSVLPLGPAVLAGTSEAHLIVIEDGAARTVEAFESAHGRDEWYTPWGGPPDVRSMSAGPSGDLYVNVHVGGILRSEDGGASWRQTIDIHSDVHEVRTVSDRPGLVLAAAAVGLAISIDGGASWAVDRTGLHNSYCRAVAVSGDTLLVTASDGPSGGRAAVYRRPLAGGEAFEKCGGGLPEWFSGNIDTGCLAATPELAAFGTEDGKVFLSEDAGANWELAASGLPPMRALVVQETLAALDS